MRAKSNELLVKAVQTGDQRYWTIIYWRHLNQLRQLISKAISRPVRSEPVLGIAHLTFGELTNATLKPTYRPIQNVGKWLEKAAINNANDWLREQLGQDSERPLSGDEAIEDAIFLTTNRDDYGVSQLTCEDSMRWALRNRKRLIKHCDKQSREWIVSPLVKLHGSKKDSFNSTSASLLDELLTSAANDSIRNHQMQADKQLDLDGGISRLPSDEQVAVRVILPERQYAYLWDDASNLSQAPTVTIPSDILVGHCGVIPTDQDAADGLGIAKNTFIRRRDRGKLTLTEFLANANSQVEGRPVVMFRWWATTTAYRFGFRVAPVLCCENGPSLKAVAPRSETPQRTDLWHDGDDTDLGRYIADMLRVLKIWIRLYDQLHRNRNRPTPATPIVVAGLTAWGKKSWGLLFMHRFVSHVLRRHEKWKLDRGHVVRVGSQITRLAA